MHTTDPGAKAEEMSLRHMYMWKEERNEEAGGGRRAYLQATCISTLVALFWSACACVMSAVTTPVAGCEGAYMPASSPPHCACH